MTQGHVSSAGRPIIAGPESRVGSEHPPYLDDAADDVLPALAAPRGEQDVEAVLAVIAVLELKEDIVRERTEALSADKAALPVECPVGADNLRLGFGPILAARTGNAIQVDDAWHGAGVGTVTKPRVITRLSPGQGCPVARPALPAQSAQSQREG